MALGEVLAEISAHLEDASEERLGENGKRTSVAIRRAFSPYPETGILEKMSWTQASWMKAT